MKSSWKYVIYAVLGLAVIFAIRSWLTGGFSHIKDAELTPYDEETLDGVLNGENADHLLPNDTTPVIISTTGASLTDAQLTTMTDAISTRYNTIAQSIADKLETDITSVFDMTLLIFGLEDGTVTQARLDLYFRSLDLWATRWVAVNDSVAREISNTAIAVVDGIEAAMDCSSYDLIKEIDESLQTEENTTYTVEIGNKSKGGFLGLSKSKSSSETRTSVRNFTQNHNRKIRYVPLCRSYQLNVPQFNALMATQSNVCIQLYGMLQATLATAPLPSMFIIPRTTTP